MHFENTKKYLRKAYPNISDTELEKLAARRTRDLLPNYSMAPRIIKGLRLAPIGDFATFAAESTRVAKNLIKYTIDDAISGNTVLTGEAAKRMAGITIAGLGADVLAEKSNEFPVIVSTVVTESVAPVMFATVGLKSMQSRKSN
jgi:hypothetical protein